VTIACPRVNHKSFQYPGNNDLRRGGCNYPNSYLTLVGDSTHIEVSLPIVVSRIFARADNLIDRISGILSEGWRLFQFSWSAWASTPPVSSVAACQGQTRKLASWVLPSSTCEDGEKLAIFPWWAFLGKKFTAIRQHLEKNINQVYNNLDTSFSSFPAVDETDPDAYKAAIDALPPGSAITIFTPDTTHYPIALYAIERKHHVLITKPATKLLSHHLALLEASRKHDVFVYVEHHKRYDPAYADARNRAKNLGDFNYFYSYMSQPMSQLETFKAWAGKDSDISYNLNSHHIDVCESKVVDAGWRPTKVTASGSRRIAEGLGCQKGTEDTITVMVDWRKPNDPAKVATGVYTASRTAPQKAGVHSNQYFHCESITFRRGDLN